MNTFVLNEKRAFNLPTSRDIINELEITDISDEELIEKLCDCCETEEQKKDIKENIKKKLYFYLDVNTDHKIKNPKKVAKELKKQLIAIVNILLSKEHMQANGLSENFKSVLMDKLTENINTCPAGFIDRVQEIIFAFNTPQSIDDLLVSYRRVLVEDAYNTDELREPTNRDIHIHNRFFVKANELGYGIPCTQIDPFHEKKEDEDIEKAIESEFKKFYNPLYITDNILKTTLNSLLISNEQDEKNIAYERASVFLKKILKNNSLSYYDLFTFDSESYDLKGPNWIKINSLVIKALHKEGYFRLNKSKNLNKIMLDKANQLTISYHKNDISNALLECYIDNKHYIGYLFSETVFLDLFPDEIKENAISIIKKLISEHIKKQTTHELNEFMIKIQHIPKGFAKNIVDEKVMNTLKEHINSLIKTADDLEHISTDLDYQNKNLIFNVIEYRILELIEPKNNHPSYIKKFFNSSEKSKAEKLGILLRNSTPENCQKILCEMNIDLSEIIKTPRDFLNIRRNQNTTTRDLIFENLKHKIPIIIENSPARLPARIRLMFSFCSFSQCCYTLQNINLPNKIKTIEEFYKLMIEFKEELKYITFDIMKDHLPSMTKTAYDCYLLKQVLTPDQFSIFFDKIANSIELLVKNYDDLILMIKNVKTLSEQQKERFIEAIIDYIPALLTFNLSSSARTLNELLCLSTPKQRCDIINRTKHFLHEIIKSADDYAQIINHLELNERNIVFNNAKSAVTKTNEEHVIHSMRRPR